MRINKIFRGIALLLAALMLLTCVTGCGDDKKATSSNGSSVVADASSVEDASSDDTSTTEESSSDTTTSTGKTSSTTSTGNTTSTGKTSSTTSNKTSTSQTTSTAPVVTEPKSINDVIDFFVDVPAGREPVILQLTDTQTIDSTTASGKKMFGNNAYYAPDNRDETLYKYIDETIKATKPDLILLTGDLTYGKYDDDGNCLKDLIEKMESYKIPWAPVYGNHEAETLMGIDWYSKQLEDAKYCLFKQNQYYNGKVLMGNGNYTVGIRQGGKVTRVFFMMDSNGYDFFSQIKKKNDHSTGAIGIQADQMNWYSSQVSYIKRFAPNANISVAFHIQLAIFRTALDERYDLANQGKTPGGFQINLNEDPKRNEKDFGYINIKPSKAWDTSNSVFNTFKNAGVDSIFVGHEHRANVGVYYQGIYLVFGQKTGTHESHNVMTADGKLLDSSNSGTPQVGGTVMKISTSGDITSMYNYVCEK